MVEKGKIANYREKLDKTLASHDLTDEKKLETLVKDQILRSSEDTSRGLGYTDDVIAKRIAEVSNFLGMLRSASENCEASPSMPHHIDWKLKQDTEEFRVMYREGPVGSPFHSLLVEGYIDAPLDVCLCVSWESALYPRWFPETVIPTFKVVVAKSLQKVRIGEEISLVRMKLSWPLSSREAILHFFEFEYLQDGLVIVLMNTIPDVDNIQMETHGFTNEGIPEADNTVRIDLVGGFALQKVTENRSYFRTIANMDIKLDFVPPSLINFISRQLIGSGFRLYQKTTASVSKGDETFAKKLGEPLYSRIRESVFFNSETNNQDYQDASTKEDLKFLPNDHVDKSLHEHEPTNNEIEEEVIKENKHLGLDKNLGNMFKAEDQKILYNGHFNGYPLQYKPATEIEEEEIKEGENLVENGEVNNAIHRKEGSDSTEELENFYKKVPISPQVEQALGTLDKLISVVREGRLKALGCAQSSPGIEGNEVRCSTVEKHVKWADKGGTSTEELVKATTLATQNGVAVGDLRSTSSDSHARQANRDMTSPVQNPPSGNWSQNLPSAGKSPVLASPMSRTVNDICENNSNEKKKTGQPRKWRLCCLHLISERLVS